MKKILSRLFKRPRPLAYLTAYQRLIYLSMVRTLTFLLVVGLAVTTALANYDLPTWTLWIQSHAQPKGDSTRYEDWRPDESFRTASECRARAALIVDNEMRVKDPTIKKMKLSFDSYILSGPFGSVLQSFLCYPSIIDPRPRK